MDNKKYLLKCMDCGKAFFTEGEKSFYNSKGLTLPKRCKNCRDARKNKREQAKHIRERQKQEQQTAIFKKLVCHIEMRDIIIKNPDSTLFVIGNGFDIIHGVRSSYYHFRDSMGKRSQLRISLELGIKKEDLWADFEDGLAYMNTEFFLKNVGFWMDTYDVKEEHDEDFSAADFFLAAETAIEPLQTIQRELPKKFRLWIDTLQPSLGIKPLTDIIDKECRYINFNYTEFLESLYGVPTDKILYIHGNRQNKKDELILGHSSDAGEEYYEDDLTKRVFPGDKMTQTLFDAQETASKYMGDYFDDTTKKIGTIIGKNADFFNSITNIETIITIGHSLSPVDYPYFEEILNKNVNRTSVSWFISWYSADDLERIRNFAEKMRIAESQIKLFTIGVNLRFLQG